NTRINWWAKGARPIADIPVTDCETTRLFSKARYYLPFPDLRDSDASTLRTSDWEIPNCLAMREGVIPALKAACTALTWPRVNATLRSSGCCRSGDSSVVVVACSQARCSVPFCLVTRI